LLALALTLLLVLALRYASMNIGMLSTMAEFIRAAQKPYPPTLCPEGVRIVVCIPALNEQGTLPSLVQRLQAYTASINAQVEILIVTTEKEHFQRPDRRRFISCLARDLVARKSLAHVGTRYGYLFDSRTLTELYERWAGHPADAEVQAELERAFDTTPTTLDVARELAGSYPYVRVLHYPFTEGQMADQLNYAMAKLYEEAPEQAPRTYFCVYNADCMPAENLFRAMLACIGQESPLVMQTVTAHLSNLAQYRGLTRYYMCASGIYQSRWSFGSEFPMYRRYLKAHAAAEAQGRLGRFYGSHYVIGHGMTFRLDFLHSLKGFNTRTNLEDLFMGYVLSYLGVRIHPIPHAEITLNPPHVLALIRQKATWFSGMADIFRYPATLREHVSGPINRPRAKVLMLKGLVRDPLPWLLGPSVPLVVCAIGLLTGQLLLVWVTLALQFLNACITFYVITRLLPRCRQDLERMRLSVPESLWLIVNLMLYSVTRNLGPAFFLIKRHLLGGFRKERTER
jgi:cellulose synthase/poly-beta-1,6-N-acetylglucosamine synthase-like glycosyltransferase